MSGLPVADRAGRPPKPAPGIAAPPCVVVLHGFADEPSDVAPFATAVTPAGGHCVVPRLRGSGGLHDDRGWTPSHHAGDLQEVCHELAPHAVVGYSYGGSVAAAYAVSVGPARVRALVVLDQAFEAHPDRTAPAPWTEAARLLWHYDYSHHLIGAARLGIPTLLVLGAQSHVVPDDEADRWARRSEPGLTVVRLPGDHRAMVQPEGAAASAIGQFLDTAVGCVS